MQEQTPIPISIVTGHLGSGKTTLIQKVLKTFPEKNFLVIENEFGEVGIDGEILKEDKNALVEINNGCICCNIQSDLEKILSQYIESGERFDHIIVEATGVANPAKIARQFVAPNYLANFFELHSVLCLIDGINFDKHRDLPEFELQLLTSDRHILSKKEDHSDSVKKELGIEALIPASQDVSWFLEKNFDTFNEDVPRVGGHKHYQKFVVTLEGEIDPFTLENYLNILYMRSMGRIIRSKGIIYFRKTPYPVLFQGVFDNLEFKELVDQKVVKPISQFVFIGMDLDEKQIERELRNCLAEEDEDVDEGQFD